MTRKKDANRLSYESARKLTSDLVAVVQTAGLVPSVAALFLIDSGMFILRHACSDKDLYARVKADAQAIVDGSDLSYPTRDAGPVGCPAGRTWADVDDWLRARGTSLEEFLRGRRMWAGPWNSAPWEGG